MFLFDDTELLNKDIIDLPNFLDNSEVTDLNSMLEQLSIHMNTHSHQLKMKPQKIQA